MERVRRRPRPPAEPPSPGRRARFRPGRRPAGAEGASHPGTAEAEPEAPGALLLVTGREALRDDVALIAAVVGARLECREEWEGVDPQDWAAVMCGTDALPPSARTAAGTLLLGGEGLWEIAAELPGLRPVALPEGEVWLSEHLGACVLDRMPGQVAVFAGAFGGAGATTFAYLTAAEAAVRGHAALLVDGDPQPGSGAVSLAGTARAQGSLGGTGSLGWAELEAVDGEISASQLSAALPEMDGIRVLSGGAEDQAAGTAETVDAVVRAGRRVFDLVVVDASRRAGLLSSLAEQTDLGVIVTQASRRGADAADQVRSQAAEAPLMLVVNGAACRGWSVTETAEAVGLPVVADCAEQRWLRTADGLGEAYELLRSRRGAALAGQLLGAVGIDA